MHAVDVTAVAIADKKIHGEGRMWPSLDVASRIFDWSSIALAFGACIVFVSTALIVWMGIVKEHHWDVDRDDAQARIASLNNETARLQADNLALQTVLLPRHIGLIGFDGPPMAKEWFAGIGTFAGTPALIQAALDDKEAQNLANEIAQVLHLFGWKPQRIDEKRSRLPNIVDGVSVSHQIGKSWTPETPNEPWMTWARAGETLADALTKAGLAIGDRPVSRYGFLNERPRFPGTTPYFDPPLEGLFVQVGSRPVAEAVEWIRRGRPGVIGNLPKSPSSPTHK
jgi:hypothetical protein